MAALYTYLCLRGSRPVFNIIDENGGAAAFKITERGITYYNEKVWIGSYFYFSIIATDSALEIYLFYTLSCSPILSITHAVPSYHIV